MNQVNLYIKKLIALALSYFVVVLVDKGLFQSDVFTISGYAENTFSFILLLPLIAGFLTLSFLHYKISGLKPAYLFDMPKADEHLNKKAGFWLLFKWIVNLFGLVYDVLAWTINGVYALFLIVMDVLLLLKTIVFWIIHALIWFLKLFVPPIVFIYKILIYYVIRWPWRIYKLSFKNIAKSVNKNYYLVSLWGAVLSIFLVLLFYGIGLLVGIHSVVFIGIIFAVLPLVWSFAEISAIRKENRGDEDYSLVRVKFNHGFEAVKAVLFYMVIFLIGIVVEILLNLMGWIPNLGFSLLGISLNINTLISLILVFIFTILAFATILMPAHVVHNPGRENNFGNSVVFLEVIGRKFLRYLLVHIPGSLFASILSLIPVFVVLLAASLSLQLKNNIMDSRIKTLEARTYTIEIKDKYVLEKRIERLNYYKAFPMNILTDLTNLKEYSNRKSLLKENLLAIEKQEKTVVKMFNEDIDSLDIVVKAYRNGDTTKSFEALAGSENVLKNKQFSLEKYQNDVWDKTLQYKAELQDVKGMTAQLPIAFLLVIIWISLFGGIVLAVIVSYFGNVYHELYDFYEDQKPSYFRKLTDEINAKDKNQPLLGFTILVIFGLILISMLTNVSELIIRLL